MQNWAFFHFLFFSIFICENDQVLGAKEKKVGKICKPLPLWIFSMLYANILLNHSYNINMTHKNCQNGINYLPFAYFSSIFSLLLSSSFFFMAIFYFTLAKELLLFLYPSEKMKIADKLLLIVVESHCIAEWVRVSLKSGLTMNYCISWLSLNLNNVNFSINYV